MLYSFKKTVGSLGYILHNKLLSYANKEIHYFEFLPRCFFMGLYHRDSCLQNSIAFQLNHFEAIHF